MHRHILLSVILLTGFYLTGQAQPLRLLDANPHYFSYRGKPTLIVGSGEHYGAVMNGQFDYGKYLKTLQSTGLNHTRLFMGAYYEKPGAFGITRNTMAPDPDALVLPWAKQGERYDLNAWNDAYFRRLRDFMNQAQQAGIIVEITLFSAYYGAGWAYHPFNGNNNLNGTPTDLPADKANTLDNRSLLGFQEAYVRKLVGELNGFDNFYFEIQNEPWAEGKDTVLVWNDFASPDEFKIPPASMWKASLEVPSEASRNWHRRVSAWIVDAEKNLPKKHLISHNIANFKQPVYVSDPNVSIYTFHYAFPEAVDLNYGLDKVIGSNETGFAGRNGDTYRRQAWRFMLRGGGLFSHLDYSFTIGHEDGSDTGNEAPGMGSPELRSALRVLKEYLERLDLATLHPDPSFVKHAEGAFAYPMKDARTYVVYLEPLSSRPVVLQLALPNGEYIGEWTDATTGETIVVTSGIFVESGRTTLEAPEGRRDLVLLLMKSP